MPTYDYKCRECGHCFDLFQNMSEKPRRTCPECAKPSLVRLIGSGSGIIFKGSGFYETDYKRQNGNGKPSQKEIPVPAPCADKSCPAAKECPAAQSPPTPTKGKDS